MAETPITGETKPKESLENKATPAETPAAEKPKDDSSQIEKLQAELKEAQQKAMRSGQLENELNELKSEREKESKKKLEQKEEFKTLYEQANEKVEELEREKEQAKQAREVRKASKDVLADYSEEVKAIAEDTGLKLNEINEDAVADFKGRLDKIQSRLGGSKVTPNNPGSSSPKEELTQDQLRETLADPAKRDAYYRKNSPVTAMMMAPEA